MALTPQITLTALLQDISGNPAGTVASPAIVRVALAAFGPELPSIPGTSNVALVGPHDYPDEGAGVTIPLYGNDVITPAGTYYAITLLDGDGNIVQCAAYRFNGTLDIDLADATPVEPSPPLPPGLFFLFLTNGAANIAQNGLELDAGTGITLTNTSGRKVRIDSSGSGEGTIYTVPFNANPVFNGNLGSSFKITLTGDVISSTITNMGGKITVPFRIIQDATGGRAFVWPANVRGGQDVNPGPNAISTQLFALDTDGSMDAAGPIMYS